MKSAKTRLGFTGLVVCGAAVLVWGAADLYAWATTGQEVLAAYGEAESVLRLVENTFTSALGKLLVGAAAGGVGLWGLRGSRPKDQKSGTRSVSRRFFCFPC